MASIWIPSLLRTLTGGQDQVTVPGRTVGDVIDALDSSYPGLKDRLCRDDQLKPSVQVPIDGRFALLGFTEPVGEESEILLLPMVAGG